jgi:hypothetical protein
MTETREICGINITPQKRAPARSYRRNKAHRLRSDPKPTYILFGGATATATSECVLRVRKEMTET